VPKEAHWDGVITSDSNWCFPKKDKFQKAMRSVYEAYASKKTQATQLQEYLKESFEMNKKYKDMVDAVDSFLSNDGESQTTVETDKVMVL
jgi:hypothetical protein